MELLVSAIIPTRKRLLRLIKTVDSLRAQADHPDCIEIVLKIDEDDMETRLGFPWQNYPTARQVITPRGRGYVEMGRFVTEAINAAAGQWCFLIDDDCWLYKKTPNVRGWDTLLREVPAKSVAQLASPADASLKGYFVTQQGYPVHLLPGIVYRHNRDTEEQLAAQAKL